MTNGRVPVSVGYTPSERFLERAQVDFLRPRRSRLAMDVPKGFGDRVDPKQAVLAALLDPRRGELAEALAVDAAVDDDMCDMDAEPPVLPRHALCDHPQSRLGRGKMRVARLAAQAGRGAGEDDRAATERNEASGRLAPDEEAAEAAHA